MRPALVCTTHDPSGTLLRLATPETLQGLHGSFGSITVACSRPTIATAEAILGAHGVDVVRADGERVETYRAALRAGAERAVHLLYVDFDRILHWQRAYPEELAHVAQQLSRAPFTLVGRTERAFLSHPDCQVLTEGPVNEVAHHLFRLPPEADLFGASWGLQRDVVRRLLEIRVPSDTTFYAAWPATLWNWEVSCQCLATEGLEWETPDAHVDEIAAIGRDAWQRRFESTEQWRMRVRMSAQWLRALVAIASETHR